MKVKFNSEMSEFLALIGGGPQGTLLGQTEYLVQSNDNADTIPEDGRFKYIDNLSILQLVCMSGLLMDYEFKQHVASDVGIDNKFFPTTIILDISTVQIWPRRSTWKKKMGF